MTHSKKYSVLEGRHITVVGLGVSGYASALFLARHGAKVFGIDQKKDGEVLSRAAELKNKGVEIELGSYSEARALEADLIVASPGLGLDHVLLKRAGARGIPVKIDLELATELCPEYTVVAVTGTNGKSSVTSMIAHMIRETGGKAVSCGNIGNPLIGELDTLEAGTVVVAEVSSFQLSRMSTFRPRVGVLLNITPDHIDWHGSYASYEEAKWSLFSRQKKNDFAVINKELLRHPRSLGLISRVRPFEAGSPGNPNISACLKVASALGIAQSDAKRALETFKALEHRMEVVISCDRFCVINDSKSTNIDSLAWALQRVKGSLVLIAGGRDKHSPYESIAPLVGERVYGLVTIGETRRRLLDAWSSVRIRETADSLEEALEKSLKILPAGGTLLFSPACASFDMFNNYQHRGRMFKELVHKHVKAAAYV